MKQTSGKNIKERINTIVEAIQDKKGEDIISLDFSNIDNSVSEFFIICSADSAAQSQAIADFIDEKIKKGFGENPWFVEGYNNAEWILLDYSDIVVHIFLNTKRKFYKLEELWADALIQRYSE